MALENQPFKQSHIYYFADGYKPIWYYPQVRGTGWVVTNGDRDIIGTYLEYGYNGNMLSYSIAQAFSSFNQTMVSNNACDGGDDLVQDGILTLPGRAPNGPTRTLRMKLASH